MERRVQMLFLKETIGLVELLKNDFGKTLSKKHRGVILR